ncbi:MAG: hypothetical protein LC799_28675 [Actinobacteria bacterium]|nr:hypothetical protein [Actinomycetota bacterium]
MHNADRITQLALVIYGLDDDIVPPEQPRRSSRHCAGAVSPSPHSPSPVKAR